MTDKILEVLEIGLHLSKLYAEQLPAFSPSASEQLDADEQVRKIEAAIALWKAKSDAPKDGWIEWSGGKSPVDRAAFVTAKLRGGYVNKKGRPAGDMRWDHSGDNGDIIAYKLSGSKS